ncbi:MAG: hypothetical protein LBR87_09310, partial [Synergistaceae bacterium]|nr:hypothetical protein [Synergistaceae bacterium]
MDMIQIPGSVSAQTAVKEPGKNSGAGQIRKPKPIPSDPNDKDDISPLTEYRPAPDAAMGTPFVPFGGGMDAPEGDIPGAARESREDLRAEYDRITADDPEMRRTFDQWLDDREYLQARYDQGLAALVHDTVMGHREAWETNPEEEIRRVYLQSRTGIPPALYGSMEVLKEAQTRSAMLDDYDLYSRLDFNTVQWLSARDNLKIARDDAEALDKVNRAIRSLALTVSPELDWSVTRAVQAGFSQDVFGGFAKANVWEAQNPPAVFRLASDLFSKEKLEAAQRVRTPMNSSLFDRSGNRVRTEPLTSAEFRKAVIEGFKMIPPARLLKGGLDIKHWTDVKMASFWSRLSDRTKPEPYLMPRSTAGRYVHDIARGTPYTVTSLVQNAVTWAAANAIAPGSGFFAATAAGIDSEASVQAGAVYDDSLSAGMSRDEALSAAWKVYLGNAALLSLTDPFQNAITLGAGRGISRLFGNKLAGSAKYAAAAWLGDRLLSSSFEGFEEVGQDLIDAWAMDREADPDALRWSFLIGSSMGGASAFGGGGIRSGIDWLLSKKADADAGASAGKAFGTLVNIAAATQTAARMPEALEDFTRQVSEGSIKEAWIDGEVIGTFAQSIGAESAEQLADELGVPEGEREGFIESVNAGIDVKADTARLVAKMAGDPAKYDALKEHIKFDPAGMSAAQAEETEKKLSESERQLLERWEKEIELVRQEGGLAAQFARDVRAQFKAVKLTGLFGKEGARGELYADLFIARMIRRASDLGTGLADLLKPGVFTVRRVAEGVRITLRRDIYASPAVLEERTDGNQDHSVINGNPPSGISGEPKNGALPPSEDGFRADIISDSETGVNHAQSGENTPDGELDLKLTQTGPDEIFRGETAFTRDAAVITLFEKADMSTLLHEMGHFFLQDMYDLSRAEGVKESVREDWNTIARWLGAEDIGPPEKIVRGMDEKAAEQAGERIKRWKNAQEKFAAAFEKYLAEGRAPSAEMVKPFRRFKEWLLKIYKTVAGILYRDADGAFHSFDINDEIRGVFDRMLAVDAAIEQQAVKLGVTPVPGGEDTGAGAGEAAEAAKERLFARVRQESEGENRERVLASARKKFEFVRSIVARERSEER